MNFIIIIYFYFLLLDFINIYTVILLPTNPIKILLIIQIVYYSIPKL